MGDVSRFELYEHMKTLLGRAARRAASATRSTSSSTTCSTACGVVITTNHLTDGIYLPAEDRRHYVAWSDCKPADFAPDYWTKMWKWYDEGGDRHVAAYLATLDISDFDPKAPPPKTPAFWSIVNANRTTEEGELQDVLDKLGNPDAVTIEQMMNKASRYSFTCEWLRDRKNRKAINHRLETCGYRAVNNPVATDGMWRVGGRRQVVYAKVRCRSGRSSQGGRDPAAQGSRGEGRQGGRGGRAKRTRKNQGR